MTRKMTVAAAVLAALCTLSACGDDAGGGDGSNPSSGTEGQAGASEEGADAGGSDGGESSPSAGTEDGSEDQTDGSDEGSGDGADLSGATVIPADQSDLTPEQVCAAIPVADLPVPARELKPFNDPSLVECMIDRADNDDVSTSVKFSADTEVSGDGTTVDGRDASVLEAPGQGCMVEFSRGDDAVSVEVGSIDPASAEGSCDAAQAIAEVIAPYFPED